MARLAQPDADAQRLSGRHRSPIGACTVRLFVRGGMRQPPKHTPATATAIPTSSLCYDQPARVRAHAHMRAKVDGRIDMHARTHARTHSCARFPHSAARNRPAAFVRTVRACWRPRAWSIGAEPSFFTAAAVAELRAAICETIGLPVRTVNGGRTTPAARECPPALASGPCSGADSSSPFVRPLSRRSAAALRASHRGCSCMALRAHAMRACGSGCPCVRTL